MRHALARATMALVIALSVLAAREAHAGLGFGLSLPAPPKKPVNGLTLVFDCGWADSPGYVPMRVTFNCAPPAATDRTLAIEISNRTLSETQPIVVNAEVVIPAGATSVTKVVPFPRVANNFTMSMNVWEDGVRLKDLCFNNAAMFPSGFGQSGPPTTLFVSAKSPDISKYCDLPQFASYTGMYGNQNNQPLTAVNQIAPFANMAAADLVENWVNYSGLDIIFISLSDIRDLAVNRRRVLQALADWAKTGGNLCVYGVGDDWKGLESLEDKLGMSVESGDAEKPRRGWTAPQSGIYNADVQLPGNAVVIKEEPDAAGAKANAKKPKAPKEPPFVTRQIRLGMVVAVASDDPFPGVAADWRWILNTLGAARWRWQMRHGLSPTDGNPGFDAFMVADAGLPPVRAYRVLITLFVIAIGPVNYWLLRRKGRLHLLLFTVPLAAIIFSVGLVAYAVVADGFDTYLRSRSFTELDQTRDEAVSWARLSYYAGLAPGDGLHFGADTAVLPIERDALFQRAVHPLREVNWSDEQHLVRGWLKARTPTQYMTVRPYKCKRELVVVEPAAGGCAVENRLDTKIHKLMLRSAGGKLCYGEDIAAGGRQSLRVFANDGESEDVVFKMLAERNQNPLDTPSGSATPVSRMFFGPASVRRFGGSNYIISGTDSMLEAGISHAFEEVGSHMPNARTYVAIVERPPDVSAGASGLVERESFHVIFGTW